MVAYRCLSVLTPLFRYSLVVSSLFLMSSSMFAACHVVTPAGSGSKTGADWNNAYAGLPGTLTRGDIYFLGDGTYAGYQFNTPTSGTTLITIKKAQAGDHCTNIGWNSGTIGSTQAVFSTHPQMRINSSYFVLDGNGSQTSAGCGGAPGGTVASAPPTPWDCGIKIDNSACRGGSDACDAPILIQAGAGNYTLRYLELVGASFSGETDNTADQMEIYAPSGGSVSTFTHMYGHNAQCVYWQYGADQRSVTYSYWWGTEVNAASSCHGQYSYDSGSDSNGVEANNVYRDITGTAIWTFGIGGSHSSWKFYNNTIFTSQGNTIPFLSDGVIACINNISGPSNCNNFTFAQNTIVNQRAASGINNENTGSYTVENNLWFSNRGGTSFNAGAGGSYTQNSNSFLQQGTSCPSGTSNVCDNASANPFVSWTTGNFEIASESSGWMNRLVLSAYNTDPSGTTRTTDRGAYQFGGVVLPFPPGNVTATVR